MRCGWILHLQGLHSFKTHLLCRPVGSGGRGLRPGPANGCSNPIVVRASFMENPWLPRGGERPDGTGSNEGTLMPERAESPESSLASRRLELTTGGRGGLSLSVVSSGGTIAA